MTLERYRWTYSRTDGYQILAAVPVIVAGIVELFQHATSGIILLIIGFIWVSYVLNNILPKSIIGRQFVSLQLKDGLLWMGKIRNVAIRVETLTSLLEFIGRPQNPNATEDLRAIGNVIGSSFAQTLTIAGGPLSDRYRSKYKGKRSLFEHMADVWGFYDYRAGFGNILTSNLHECQNSLHGEIIISKSFLTYPEEKPYCSFMEGYIIGVLETLLPNKRFSITETQHNTTYTLHKTTYDNSCHFLVKPLS